MERKTLIWLLCTAALRLGMLGTARITSVDGFMVAVLLEFFVVCPLWSLATGIFAGWDGRLRWRLAAANSLLFLLSSWIFLEMGQLDFLYFTLVYLAIGLLSTWITAMARRKYAKR
ncbi:MAG: hypothetical protein HFE95_10220 [Acutalibacter sp.]|nr:hypothetical protein [Acutalibacter sp.]